MRKRYILGILITLFWMSGFSLSQPLNNFKPGSEPDGFRDIKWGTDLSTFKNMKFSRTDPSYGRIDIYLRLEEDSTIGIMKFKNIEYLFWKGKFSGISIVTEDSIESKSLREAVFAVFGKGSKPHADQEYYVWEGESTLMALEIDPVGEKALLWMMCKSILSRMELEDKSYP
jgi:hypothetical protein